MRLRVLVAAAVALIATIAAGPSAATAPDAGAGGGALQARHFTPIAPEAPAARLFDEAVLALVNDLRARAGLARLQPDPGLAAAAQTHAENMARLRHHSHRVPVAGAERLAQRIARQGVHYRVAGETIGMEKLYRLAGRPVAPAGGRCRFTYADTGEPVPRHTYATLAQAAVARWMASPRHRAALLRPDFRRAGSGLGIDPAGAGCGDVYLVQNFAG